VAYKFAILPPVKEYLRSLTGLSRQAHIRVFANLHASLGNVSDAYRNNPDTRTSAGSSRFVFSLLLRDTDGDGQMHEFRFIVNDAAAE